MRARFHHPTALTLIAISTVATHALAQRPAPKNTPWTEISVTSAILGGERKVYVVPPSDTSRPPAVLILLDANDRPQFESAIANVHFLESRHAILPVLIVGIPNGKDRTLDLTPPATGSDAKTFPTAGGAEHFVDFISAEVLPAVRARYRTLPFTVLAGHSFGGLFVVHVAATKPGAFSAAIAMSPSLWWNDSASVAPYATAVAHSAAPLRLFVTSGAYEPPIDVTARRFVALLDSLHPVALTYRYQRYPADSHGLTPLPSLVEGLQFVFEPVSVATTAFTLLPASSDSAAVLTAFRQAERNYVAAAPAFGIDPVLPEAFVREAGLTTLNYFHQPRAAVVILQSNVEHYAKSAASFENLGDALLAAADTTGAKTQYHTAANLAVHAHDHAAKEIAEKLRKLEPAAQAGAPRS